MEEKNQVREEWEEIVRNTLNEYPAYFENPVTFKKGLGIVDSTVSRVEVDFGSIFNIGSTFIPYGLEVRVYDDEGKDILTDNEVSQEEKNRILTLYKKHIYQIIAGYVEGI